MSIIDVLAPVGISYTFVGPRVSFRADKVVIPIELVVVIRLQGCVRRIGSNVPSYGYPCGA